MIRTSLQLLRLAARCGMPIPACDGEGNVTDAQVQFAWFLNDLLEPPGAPGPLAVLARAGLKGSHVISGVYAKQRRVSVWHVAANAGSPEVVNTVCFSSLPSAVHFYSPLSFNQFAPFFFSSFFSFFSFIFFFHFSILFVHTLSFRADPCRCCAT
jgi:hypothetical protein